MDKFSYEIGRIAGILECFSYVNNKTNHGFSFEIKVLDAKKTIEDSSTAYLRNMYPDSEINFESVSDWKSVLKSCFEKWLFCYQPHRDDEGNMIEGGCGSYFSYLKDIDNSFSMSDSGFREEFIIEILASIESTLNVIRAVQVHLNTKEWYECDWNDLALEGKNGNLFLHLGVSD